MKSSLLTRNIRIRDRRTSVRLEPQLWRALETIAELEKTSINELCTSVEEERGPEGGFTSALRVFIVEYFGAALREERGEATAVDAEAAQAEARESAADLVARARAEAGEIDADADDGSFAEAERADRPRGGGFVGATAPRRTDSAFFRTPA